jgi:hypothetical protein
MEVARRRTSYMMEKLVLAVGIDKLRKLPLKDHQPLITPYLYYLYIKLAT